MDPRLKEAVYELQISEYSEENVAKDGTRPAEAAVRHMLFVDEHRPPCFGVTD